MPLHITHDATIDIATGRSRKEVNWKNKEMLWSELVKMLSTTHRTAESYAEYLSSKKARQDEIKDIGGFVGGYLTGGRRKADTVLHRQLITLDLDYAQTAIWDDFTLLYDSAAVLYSTHKHSPESPRLRLILPLDRPVRPDEYEAIARRVAGILGIENFDPTTFEPSRLMYWPSTAKDGAYLFEYQDGPWVCADEVLATYQDWRDSSEWPVSERNYNIIQRAIKKQGDPLEKPGVIGAFCRTYSIAEVIEAYLSDVYDACDVPDRYTYKEGSTTAGLVVYEDKYAFSHHGTDPVSGKLCNAFDLVRIHKFGLKDEDAKEGTPGNKMPSYTAMMDFAAKDIQVKKLLGSERLSDAKGDFEGVEFDDEEPGNDEWLGDLGVDRHGNYHNTIDNIAIILENDPALKKCIAFDEFEQRAIAKRNLPWRKVTHQTRYLTDKDDDNLAHYLEKVYDISSTKLDKALSVLYVKNSFHPIRDYLNSLKWDGESRVDNLFIDYMGSADNDYVKAVTRKVLVAAVARVFQPGIKFDYVITFVGKQGLGKSSLIGKLGREWFSDSFSTVQGKEAYEQIQGVWLVEMGELAGLRKAEAETIKHYISKREDRYRVAYGKRVENFPRQCVFFGSTNKPDFLRDPTGNRRFWPVDIQEDRQIKNVFTDLNNYEIDQVWAEAVMFYKKKEPLFLHKELEDFAYRVQEEHSERDERAGIIQKYLDTLLPVNWEEMDTYQRRSFLQGDELQGEGFIRRERVCAAEIWCEALGGFQKEMTTFNTKFIHDIMRSLDGWEEYKSRTTFKGFGNQKGYYRKHQSLVVNGQKTTSDEKW